MVFTRASTELPWVPPVVTLSLTAMSRWSMCSLFVNFSRFFATSCYIFLIFSLWKNKPSLFNDAVPKTHLWTSLASNKNSYFMEAKWFCFAEDLIPVHTATAVIVFLKFASFEKSEERKPRKINRKWRFISVIVRSV